MLDACGVEYVIRAMQNGYVQCSRLGCVEIGNYRCKELQVLAEASDDEESQPLTSEMGQEDLLDRDMSGQVMDLAEKEIAEEEPDQDRPDEP